MSSKTETSTSGITGTAKAVAGVALLLGAGAYLGWGWWSNRAAERAEAEGQRQPDKAWYSDDDGKTWFADAYDRVVPFDRGGKPAVRAWVYRCGEKSKPFVARLERSTARAAAELAKVRAAQRAGGPPSPDDLETPWKQPIWTEVKRPGEAAWKNAGTPGVIGEYGPKCPDGASGTPALVTP